MSLQAALSFGLNAVPGCSALCYVDMQADLVLATDARKRRPQEVFNDLSGLARDILHMGPARAAGEAGTGASDIAVLSGQTATLVFARAERHPGHALCLLCDPTDDVAELKLQTLKMREAVADAV